MGRGPQFAKRVYESESHDELSQFRFATSSSPEPVPRNSNLNSLSVLITDAERPEKLLGLDRLYAMHEALLSPKGLKIQHKMGIYA